MSAAEYNEEINQAILLNSITDLLEVFREVHESGLNLENVLNFANTRKETCLHLAASRLQDEFVRLLLLNGADPNVCDINGRTPILQVISSLRDCQCQCCVRKAVRCIQFLGEYGARMNEADKTGETPLYLSAILGVEETSLELLKQGASIETESGSTRSIMNILMEKMPDIILPIFDQSITMDLKQRHQPNFHIAFDMSVILSHIKNGSYDHDGKKDREVPHREMGFLCQILDNRVVRDRHIYRAILQHPIVHVFTDIKWNRLRILYFAYLAFQVNLLGCYVLFLCQLIFVDCPVAPVTSGQFNETGTLSFVKETLFGSSSSKCEIGIWTRVLGVYVLFCTSVSGAKELFHVATDFWSYIVDILNYAQLAGIVTMSITTIIALDPIELFHFWLFPLASFGVGICWLQLFLHLGQMPTCSIYVDMFSKVTVNFCVSLAMYSPIIIAFAMSYCMLFPSNTRLIDIPVAILRVLTMMIGELNFESLFAPDQWRRNPLHPLLAHLWYAIFLIVVSMVLMNLLVGLAVNDIGGCRKDSELVVMKRKIRYLNYLEKSFYLGTLFTPKFVKVFLRNRVNVVPRRSRNSGVVHCKPEGDKEKSKKYSVIVCPSNDSRFLSVTRAAIHQWIIRQQNTGTNRSTFCHRESNSTHQFQRLRSPGLDPETEIRTGSSISGKSNVRSAWKGTPAESKRISKMESSVKRVETKLADYGAKLDEILALVSGPHRDGSP